MQLFSSHLFQVQRTQRRPENDGRRRRRHNKPPANTCSSGRRRQTCVCIHMITSKSLLHRSVSPCWAVGGRGSGHTHACPRRRRAHHVMRRLALLASRPGTLLALGVRRRQVQRPFRRRSGRAGGQPQLAGRRLGVWPLSVVSSSTIFPRLAFPSPAGSSTSSAGRCQSPRLKRAAAC